MKTYEFTINFRDLDYMSEELAAALYAAGCDDCSPGSDCGRAYADFAREATSLEAAIASAVANVQQAGCTVDQVVIADDRINALEATA